MQTQIDKTIYFKQMYLHFSISNNFYLSALIFTDNFNDALKFVFFVCYFLGTFFALNKLRLGG